MQRDQALAIAETIDGWMTRRELEWLFDTAAALPDGASWVEAGTWKGRSLFAVAMGLPPRARLAAVDSVSPSVMALPTVPTPDWVWDQCLGTLRAIRQRREDLLLAVCRADTAEASGWFAEASLDVAFLDGDHSAEGVARDIDSWCSKIKPGGMLCGHDYGDGFPGVVQTVDERFPQRQIAAGTSIWYTHVGGRDGAAWP